MNPSERPEVRPEADERSSGLSKTPDDHEGRHQHEDGGVLDAVLNTDTESLRPSSEDEARPTTHREPDELGRLDPKVDPMSSDNR
ncbi:hypothetical protein [Deinococcus peraridilitoris]|uniref:Uncharacterized protein n=1 Tax=Deinococcus peraridilitoris (strain DSM 19664 / LMG 22246 / CIP 109416 / KR-200) TaxID=937777 RepID=L0A7Q6_DEIPD|nr:hypothetical protein [Deinococcus peraridilitoris]AFZ69202.1 hypothetical protein Deipe_3778 [Deinococcus peraridilitoris DSM 19664]